MLQSNLLYYYYGLTKAVFGFALGQLPDSATTAATQRRRERVLCYYNYHSRIKTAFAFCQAHNISQLSSPAWGGEKTPHERIFTQLNSSPSSEKVIS